MPPRIVQRIRYDLYSGKVAARSVPADELTFNQQGASEETFEYDAGGRMVKHTAPWGAVTTVEHSGLTTMVTDPRQHKTVTTLDALGRTVAIENAKGEVTTYGYGPFSGLWSVTAPDATTTKVIRDAFGRVKHRDDPDRGPMTLHHDGFGQLRASTDALNRKVSMAYDPLGRPLTRVDSDGSTRWEWDTAPMGNSKAALGRIAKVTSPGGAIKQFTYDDLARPAAVKLTLDGESFSAATGYDSFGRLSTITYPSSPNVAPLVVSYGYDDHGHMLMAKDVSTGLAYWTLTGTDGAGRITGERFGNKVTTTRAYFDEKNRVKAIHTENDLGATLQDLAYGYDDNLNLSTRADSLAGPNGSETFLYDALDRVSCATLTGMPGCQQAWSYEQNGSGNLHTASGVGVYTYDPQHPHAVHTAGPDVFSYDAVGNQIGRSGAIVAYTAFDKPKKIAAVALEYDGDQQRIRKTTSEAVTVSLDDLYERVTHTSTGVVEHRYTVHGSERAVAIVTREEAGPSATLYAHVDHLGSVDALSDEQGKLVEKRSYDAFGARRNPDWGKPPPPSFSSLTPHGFTWHESDDELGLVNMRGRMYDPKVGRFLTADPIVGDPGAGEQWNPYGYVGNNPLTFIDPSGFDAEPMPTGPPPAGCEASPQLCAFNGKWVSPIVVTVHGTKPPEPPPKPKEEAIEAGVALVPTDVKTTGTAVGTVPAADTTAPKSPGRRVGRFAFGMGKAYVGQVLETVKSITLNVATFGGYSIVKTWWSIGEGIFEGIERHDFGEAGWQVGLSGAMHGINAVNPVWGAIVTGIHGVEAVQQGDDGEARRGG
ncbi:MAG: RHS repeat-associated core domain-containing protein [Anaeromyxobacteraceae bacterium]